MSDSNPIANIDDLRRAKERYDENKRRVNVLFTREKATETDAQLFADCMEAARAAYIYELKQLVLLLWKTV